MPNTRMSSCLYFRPLRGVDRLDNLAAGIPNAIKFSPRRMPMSNPTQAARKLADPSAKDAVRRVLDAVKADKRTSLTAPEGKLVCDAYGTPAPQEGVAKPAAAAAKLATPHGFPAAIN